MSDATLSRDEVAAVRRLVETLGLGQAAAKLNVHVATINVILAGRAPRNATVQLMRASLGKVRA